MTDISILNDLFNKIANTDIRLRIKSAYYRLNDIQSHFHKNCASPAVISEAPAGAKHHHWWKGGYFDHLIEMYEYAKSLYRVNENNVNFGIDDVAVVILLHDISKGIAYQYLPEATPDPYIFTYRPNFFKRMSFDQWTNYLIMHFGIKLTQEQFLAIQYAEGGWSEQANLKTEVTQLSYFMHILDLYSSQILGKNKKDKESGNLNPSSLSFLTRSCG